MFATTPFSSGSNGSDGAFDIPANDPRVIAGVFTWDPVRDNLDVDGDNVYHFTTIHIPYGVRVRILASKTRKTGPIIWLATGLVLIEGSVDLSGQSGYPATQDNYAVRIPAIPGPGGYPGGNGSRNGSTPESGAGPGAAAAQSAAGGDGCPASHAAPPTDFAGGGYFTECNTRLAATYGTNLVLPLVGGSGGGGGVSTSDSCVAGGGGAGGGAIRIVSSTEIQFGQNTASIYANGGIGGTGGFGCGLGGSGSGGAIHLQAPLISSPNGGAGGYGLQAVGVSNGLWQSSDGRIRVDATVNTATIGIGPTPTTGPLVSIPVAPLPSISIVSINGTPAPANPAAGYTTPDVSVNTSSPIAITVQGANIPANSTITLRISSEGASSAVDQVVPVTLNSQLQATANVTFPVGVSRFYVRAIW